MNSFVSYVLLELCGLYVCVGCLLAKRRLQRLDKHLATLRNGLNCMHLLLLSGGNLSELERHLVEGHIRAIKERIVHVENKLAQPFKNLTFSFTKGMWRHIMFLDQEAKRHG